MISTDDTKARLGRPKSDTKREAILQAGVCLFMDIGYARTSMDAIAQAASVSKQTVYSHFPSKDDLFKACVMGKVSAYGLDMVDIPGDAPLTEVLTTLGHRLLDLLCDPGVVQMYRTLISETNEFPQLAESFWENGPQASVDSLARYFENSTDSRFTPIDHPESAAEDFLALAEGHYLMRLMMNSIETIPVEEKDAHVARCVTNFVLCHEK